MSDIRWLGHSAFKISCNGAHVVIDPFLAPQLGFTVADVGHADLVLVTHDHGDHVGDAVSLCRRTGAQLGAIVGTAGRLAEEGVPTEHILNGIGFNMGGTVPYKGAEIVMVPAFHSSNSGTPAGYIITLPDGLSIYHAGDTCVFGDMALWGEMYPLDLALLPMGGVFTMGPAQAAMACKLLGARHVIPMHWGTFPVLEQNTARFSTALPQLAPFCKPLLLSPGQSCHFDGPDQPAKPGRA